MPLTHRQSSAAPALATKARRGFKRRAKALLAYVSLWAWRSDKCCVSYAVGRIVVGACAQTTTRQQVSVQDEVPAGQLRMQTGWQKVHGRLQVLCQPVCEQRRTCRCSILPVPTPSPNVADSACLEPQERSTQLSPAASLRRSRKRARARL